MREYSDFLINKSGTQLGKGFDPVFMPSAAFPFQRHLIEWACRQGRGAMFADCGLGKTLMQLAWAQNVVERTNGNALIVTVLAVVPQIVEEAEKFGIPAKRSVAGEVHRGVTVTNYEQLHKFDPAKFDAVACDESSILKNFDGTTRAIVTAFTRRVRHRLLASATPAPNDYTELGTSSEALGYLGHIDMLNKFFKNNMNNSARGRVQGEVIKWRFKGHAEEPFWDWVSGWAVACRKPSDIGFSNDGYDLPPLITREHIVKSAGRKPGHLFHLPAVGLQDQRQERKATVIERCERAAELAGDHDGASVMWCHTNEEGDLLESMSDDVVQVSGKDSDAAKERKFHAFMHGEVRNLVTKPSIGAWGLNFQHCHHMTFFPSHSFEQYYQSVRRFWRFGQQNAVIADIVVTEGERGVVANLNRKEAAAEAMFDNLVGRMGAAQDRKLTTFTNSMEVPQWL